LARVGVALGHPLRVRIIRALMSGRGSAATLSRTFEDVPLGDVYYHLTVLERCRIVELCRVRPVRGAKERIYELRLAAEWGKVWERLPPPALAGFRNAWLGEFAGLATAALDSGTTERRGTVLSGRSLRTDERGFKEIGERLRAALAAVERIAAEGRQRLERSGAGEEIDVVTGAAAFEAPPSDWWETRHTTGGRGEDEADGQDQQQQD
jgi:DNA-binding transcriptional ArsR family regulator